MNPLIGSIRRAKRWFQERIYPLEEIATVRRGPLRGCRYVVSEQSGWAPILGRWEPEAQRLYVALVEAGDTVWDLGANTGIHTLLFSRSVGDSGRVVAFEPLQVNVREIQRTCELNGARNVRIVARAVSDRAGRARFLTGRHDKQGSLVGIGSEDGGSIEVECTTLDAEMEAHGAPDFVKIDIEGAESAALAGFSRAAACHPTFAIDLHTPREDRAVGAWLARHGYRVYRLRDAVARRMPGGGALLRRVGNLGEGWPHPDGMWGTVVAVHPSRGPRLAAVEALAGSREAAAASP